MSARKFSRKREAILELIRSTHTHPTADWIYNQLKGQIPDLSLGTVYRNIALFKKEGIIHVVGVVGGQERFDADVSKHSHFICSVCGNVLDIEEKERISDTRIEDEYGIKIERHEIVFYGTCAECMTAG